MENNVINRILDNYYSQCLGRRIQNMLLVYNLDLKIVKDGSCYSAKVKKRKYNDDQYITLVAWHPDEALSWLCDYARIRKEIEDRIEKFFQKKIL